MKPIEIRFGGTGLCDLSAVFRVSVGGAVELQIYLGAVKVLPVGITAGSVYLNPEQVEIVEAICDLAIARNAQTETGGGWQEQLRKLGADVTEVVP